MDYVGKKAWWKAGKCQGKAYGELKVEQKRWHDMNYFQWFICITNTILQIRKKSEVGFQLKYMWTL